MYLSMYVYVFVCMMQGMIASFPGPTTGTRGAGPFELGMVLEFCENGSLHTLLFKKKHSFTFR